jgi:hypothetical protein
LSSLNFELIGRAGAISSFTTISIIYNALGGGGIQHYVLIKLTQISQKLLLPITWCPSSSSLVLHLVGRRGSAGAARAARLLRRRHRRPLEAVARQQHVPDQRLDRGLADEADEKQLLDDGRGDGPK